MVVPTLGYHVEWGLASQSHNFTIVYGANVGEKVLREYAGGERFRRLFDGSCTEAT
jgi:hypothetical protein